MSDVAMVLATESGGGGVLNHSNIEAVPNKRQPGDYPRTTKNKNIQCDALIKDRCGEKK